MVVGDQGEVHWVFLKGNERLRVIRPISCSAVGHRGGLASLFCLSSPHFLHCGPCFIDKPHFTFLHPGLLFTCIYSFLQPVFPFYLLISLLIYVLIHSSLLHSFITHLFVSNIRYAHFLCGFVYMCIIHISFVIPLPLLTPPGISAFMFWQLGSDHEYQASDTKCTVSCCALFVGVLLPVICFLCLLHSGFSPQGQNWRGFLSSVVSEAFVTVTVAFSRGHSS